MAAKSVRRNKMIPWVRNWLAQIADPVWVGNGITGYLRYIADWYRYVRMPDAETIRIADSYPQVHDRTGTSIFDAHYFYGNGWAARRILSTVPRYHVDVGSQSIFANMLGAEIPVTFTDYRPLFAELPGLICVGGDLLALPFANRSIPSLSSLHVIEHVGLGRYGDPLNPQGTRRAVRELARVLAPGGNLFLSTPIGRSRVCFNAHRVHPAEEIREMASELELVEFSGITDEGRFVEKVDPAVFRESEYACGMFWFRSPQTI